MIKVENISKVYKLYDSPLDRVKESINLFGKQYYKEFYALNRVSLEINRGQTVAIIGKNGSGKSTLLKIMTGVLTPTTGSISVCGKVSALLELGAGFNPELTGVENIYFNGTLLGYSKEEMDAKVDKIIAFADIDTFIRQPVKLYSSGMFVRLAFAVAINVDPDILIIDEALSVGDIRFQRKCFSKIEEFHSEGKTVIFVSHGLDTVNSLCDYAYLLHHGEILEEGIPKHVTKIYQKMMLGGDVRATETNRLDDSLVCETDGINRDTKIPFDTKFKQLVSQKLENWDGIKKAEIIEFGILDKERKKVTYLETGASYTIFSRVLLHDDVRRIHLGFPIKNTKGILLFATNSEIQKVDIVPQQKGCILEGRVDLTMWLAPGNYFLSFRAGNLEEEFDCLHDEVHFVVLGPGNIHPGSIVYLQEVVTVQNLNID